MYATANQIPARNVFSHERNEAAGLLLWTVANRIEVSKAPKNRRPDRENVWRIYPLNKASSNAAAGPKTITDINKVDRIAPDPAPVFSEKLNPPGSIPKTAAKAIVAPPNTNPAKRFLIQPEVNAAPRARNGRRSRYFPHSHPISKTTASETKPFTIRNTGLPGAYSTDNAVRNATDAVPRTSPDRMNANTNIKEVPAASEGV